MKIHGRVEFFTLLQADVCSSCKKPINSNEQAVTHIAERLFNQQRISSTSVCMHKSHLNCAVQRWANRDEQIESQKLNGEFIRTIRGQYCQKRYAIPDPFFRKIQPLLLWERNKLQYGLLHLFAGSVMTITLSGSLLLFRSKVTPLAISNITKKALLVLSGLTSGGLSYFTTKTIYRFSLDYFVKD